MYCVKVFIISGATKKLEKCSIKLIEQDYLIITFGYIYSDGCRMTTKIRIIWQYGNEVGCNSSKIIFLSSEYILDIM